MGICGSKIKTSQVEKSQQLKQQNSFTSPQISASQQALNKKHQDEHKNNLNQVAVNWKSNTVGIWKRSYDKLAIHTDIPRLGHKIEIIDKLDRLSNINFVNLNTPPPTHKTTSNSVQNGASEQQSPPSSSSPSSSSTTTTNITDNNTNSQLEQETNDNNNNNNKNNNNNSNNTTSETNTANDSNTTTTTDLSPSSSSFSNILKENSNVSLLHDDKYTSLTTLTSAGQLTTSQVLKKEEVVLQVLAGLAYLLDGEEKEKHIRKTFPEYIKSNGGDMSQQLLGFLVELGEESKVMSLLKVCHQKVILPSYYFIKSNLFEDLPFRDKRGSWKMRITIESDQSIVATHSKRQQSTVGQENDPEFEFEWCLSILFDKDLQITNLKVDVVDLIISQNISQERKSLIQHSFSLLQNATQATNNSPLQVNDPIPLNKIEN